MNDRGLLPRRITPIACENLNHRRPDPPVGHCPECGVLVNQARHRGACAASAHDDARRRQSRFCSSCGTQLVAAR